MLRYHDYHLKEYRVANFGSTITFDLIYDYPGSALDISIIEFREVALYNFTHCGGAIITDIEETPLSKVLSDHAKEIEDWADLHGMPHWKGSLKDYETWLISTGYLGWYIESAIGFQGFVIGKAVVQMSS